MQTRRLLLGFVVLVLLLGAGGLAVAGRRPGGWRAMAAALGDTATPTLTPTPTLSPARTPTASATSPPSPTPTAIPTFTPTPTPTPIPEVVLWAAGDIASCEIDTDEATARLLDGQDGLIAMLGDAVYNSGSEAEFATCYGPTWGRHKDRTRPAVGNHEYQSGEAEPYFAYFGAAAGEPGLGYYSYDYGAWHVVVLNSNCGEARGCRAGSPQEQWLRADLDASTRLCTLAYWHHPRFSSGEHGSDARFTAFWQALVDHDAEVVLAGHDHDYERFAPQTPAGEADAARGLREFVVGTGGRSHYGRTSSAAHSEVWDGATYGVLKLTLRATGYDWLFVPVEGQAFTDSGRGECH